MPDKPERLFFIFFFLFLNVGKCLAYERTSLDFKTDTVTATCGHNNGKIIVTASGGSGHYLYKISGSFPFVPFSQPANIILNLYGGNYTVTVHDLLDNNEVSKPVVLANIYGAQILSMIPQPSSCLNNDGIIQIELSGGTPSFQYAVNGGSFSPLPSTGTLKGLASGTETITVKDQNGCLVSSTLTLPLKNNLTLTMPAPDTLCEGLSTNLTVGGNANIFAWSPATGLSNPSIGGPVANPDVTTTYTVTASLGICTTHGSVTVDVLPAPVAEAGGGGTTCYEKTIQLEGSGGTQFNWSPAKGLSNAHIANPAVESPKTSTAYSLNVVDANGCKSLKSSSVSVNVLPPVKVQASGDTAVVVGETVALAAVDVSNTGFRQYAWSPVTGLSDPTIGDPTALVHESITYTVTVTTADGCQGDNSIGIKAYPHADIYVPNAFTPNNDGHNDLLRAIPIGIKDFKFFSIYSRWGQQVFTTANAASGWDGTLGGHTLPSGAFVWVTGGTDFTGRAIERKGVVLLIR